MIHALRDQKALHRYVFTGSLIILFSTCIFSQKSISMFKHSNALIHENSPYLIQHAHNPVDWFPWGPEALEKAKKENKMLIISIGYAACHWCHVMEHESYEDEEVAAIMNEHFINIKVDREERPDIDDIYMTACQLSNGRNCGWPLNAFALPDGRPVWAGTYFPKQQWISILQQFIDYQRKDQERLEAAANSILKGMKQLDNVVETEEKIRIKDQDIKGLHDGFLEVIDWRKGGRTGQPKFPLPNNYEFLLEYHHQFEDPKSLEAVDVTLQNMAFGGIYDQLGGGFARYSVDKDWFAPHFEKMLYDNAQLVSLYSKAYQLNRHPLYAETVIESLAFIQRELSSPEGAFYSSLDADSEGEEGKFYVWTYGELQAALPDESTLELFMEYYHGQKSGNWEEGKNILHRSKSLEDFCREKGAVSEEVKNKVQSARARLMEIRANRIRPGLDDKILSSWNALMLQGYLDAYRALGHREYLETALKNGRFLRTQMMEEDFRMWRSYKDGHKKINAFLDDYAATIKAFMSLFETTQDLQWLDTAKNLTDYVLEHFWDASKIKLYYTSKLDPSLVTRKSELNDNVIPGSVSMMAKNLLFLSHYFSEDRYRSIAEKLFESISHTLKNSQQASYYSNWLSLAIHLNHPPKEVVIIGDKAPHFLEQLAKEFIPNALFIATEEENSLPLTKDRGVPGKTLVYICKNKVCQYPVASIREAKQLLSQR
jgi:uncharacterized protein YyaL (SSP411 family)